MTTQELNELLQDLRTTNCKDDTISKVLQAAADSVTLSALRQLLPSVAVRTQAKRTKTQKSRKFLKFNQKEISTIPMTYKNIFATGDRIVRYRKKENGVYEARFHRDGLHIEVSSKDLTQLKEKFIEKLNEQSGQSPLPVVAATPGITDVKTFGECAGSWLAVKKTVTKDSTCREYERMLNTDILPVFGERKATEISREDVQSFLSAYVSREKLRTAHKLFLILRCIFDVVAEDYRIPSPMKKVVLPHYQVRKGSAFTYDEEKRLVGHCLCNTDKPTAHALLVLLYTGLRRSELASLEIIDGKWLQCDTAKERMGNGEVKRRIPFTPMMKRVLPYIDFDKAKSVNLNSLHTALKRLFPAHHLHELRYTFITRLKESGVHGELVLLWDGHEEDRSIHSSKVDRGYTDFSEAFQLKEAGKVDYLQWEFPVPPPSFPS